MRMPTPTKVDATIKPTDVVELIRWIEWDHDVRVRVQWMLSPPPAKDVITVFCGAWRPNDERWCEPITGHYTMWPSCDHKTLLGAVYWALWTLESTLDAAKQLREALAVAKP